MTSFDSLFPRSAPLELSVDALSRNFLANRDFFYRYKNIYNDRRPLRSRLPPFNEELQRSSIETHGRQALLTGEMAEATRQLPEPAAGQAAQVEVRRLERETQQLSAQLAQLRERLVGRDMLCNDLYERWQAEQRRREDLETEVEEGRLRERKLADRLQRERRRAWRAPGEQKEEEREEQQPWVQRAVSWCTAAQTHSFADSL